MTRDVSLSGIKVLLVEDSVTQAMQLKQSLEEHKLDVVAATDGQDAIGKLKDYTPDIFISDITMSPMDGYEFCRYVKTSEKYQDIPFVILTNLSETTDVIKGIECGADGFMTKPYDLNLLLSNISDVLGNRKILSQPPEIKQIALFLSGQEYRLTVNQTQIISLLLSTYSNAIYKNLELEKAHRQLNRTNLELAKKNEELEKLNKEKNQFLGMAAHDLRNPLSVIGSYSTLLQESLKDQIPKETFKMLVNIQKSSAFMLDLINNLLNISVIESGNVALNLKGIDLVELAKDVLALQETMASKKQINIISHFQDNIPLVECDSNKITQVLNNILGNAIKFSNPGTQIDLTISYNNQDKTVNIEIKDQGIGIPPEEIDSIFKAFVKGKAKGTAGEISTGLGLAIVNRIVEAHHGSIKVESVLGNGSTFFVKLPVKQEGDFTTKL